MIPRQAAGRPVVVVGDVGVDVITRPSGPIAWGSDTPSTVVMAPGGAGGNTAVWLAYAGCPTHLIARLGADSSGHLVRVALERRGVGCHFHVDPRLPTCCVVVLLDSGGERTMFPDRGANAALSAREIDLPHLAAGFAADGYASTGHLHLSGYVLFDASSRPAGLSALGQARTLGWSTSVDPQAAALVSAVGADTFLDWVSGVDVLLPNEGELAALGGVANAGRAVRHVVATRGRDGASWYRGALPEAPVGPGAGVGPTAGPSVGSTAGAAGSPSGAAAGAAAAQARDAVHVPAVRVSRCTDSTGAGDAFNGGFLAAWVRGVPIEEALGEGVRLGAMAVANRGAHPS